MKHLISLFFFRTPSRTLLLSTILALALALHLCSPWDIQAMNREKDTLEERTAGRADRKASIDLRTDTGDRKKEVTLNDAGSGVTVNLSWVCDKPTPQKYIYPAETEDELKVHLNKAASWARLHPADDVNIWYDSQLLSATAASSTQAVLDQDYRATPNIRLKDLRTLPIVQRYPSAFHPNLSVYFRVDLDRLVAALELLSGREDNIFAYADLDMEPVDCHQIADTHKEELDEYGILMAKGRHPHVDGYLPYFENGFQIIKGNPLLLQALDQTVIKPSIARGQWVASLWGSTEPYYSPNIISDWELLARKNHQNLKKLKQTICSTLEESVYNAYWQAFFHLHAAKNHVKLGIMDIENILAECQSLFAVTPDHIHFFPNLEYQVEQLNPKYMHLFIERSSQEPCLYVPTVEVPIPASRFLKK